jgi:hypothetical protein
MKIINTKVADWNPRAMTSFYFRAPITEVETVSGTPLACIRFEKQLTTEGAAVYYCGGGVWVVCGYAYDGRDTLAAYYRAANI